MDVQGPITVLMVPSPAAAPPPPLYKLYGPLPATGAGTARAPPPSLISDWWFLAEVSTLPTTTPLPLPYTPACGYRRPATPSRAQTDGVSGGAVARNYIRGRAAGGRGAAGRLQTRPGGGAGAPRDLRIRCRQPCSVAAGPAPGACCVRAATARPRAIDYETPSLIPNTNTNIAP